MRRYLVFAGSRRCSFGGWRDYKSNHDTEQQARHAARTQLRWCDWAETVDLQTGVCMEVSRQQVGDVSRAR